MERRELPEIEQAADRYRKIRDERCALSKKESEAKSALIQVMMKANRTFYSYNGLTVELSNVENVKVKSSKDEDDAPNNGRPRRQTAHSSHSDVIIEEQPQEEEHEQIAMCACGHPASEHEANGACAWDACNCDGLTPGVNVVSEQVRERMHKEAVARWRRERPQVETQEEEADIGGTPFPTEYTQEQINEFETYYAAMKI